MALFDQLPTEYHRCFMDNLYMLAKFAKFAANSKRKVMIAGVVQQGGRGVP